MNTDFLRYGALLVLALQQTFETSAQAEDETFLAGDLASGEIVGPFVLEALRSNPGLAAQEKRYEAAKAGIPATAALPNPTIQLTHFVESIQTRTGPQRQAIMLQQPIPWLGKLDQQRAAARAQSESLWHAYAAQQFEVIQQVAESVLETAYLDKAVAITEQNARLLERLETVVENRVKGGGELSSLLLIQVETERIKDQALRLKASKTAASAKLDSLMGKAPQPGERVIVLSKPQPLSSDPDAWLEAISERAPQIAMIQALIESEIARTRIAELANRPNFTVGLNYIRTGDAMNPNTPDSGKDPWAIMVGMALPIWGKANNALEVQASLQKEALEVQIEEKRYALRGQARGLIAKLRDAESRIQRYDTKLLPLARQAQEITQTSYEAANATVLDLIESDRTLLEMETEYWQAVTDAWSIRWKLATLSGGTWLE